MAFSYARVLIRWSHLFFSLTDLPSTHPFFPQLVLFHSFIFVAMIQGPGKKSSLREKGFLMVVGHSPEMACVTCVPVLSQLSVLLAQASK